MAGPLGNVLAWLSGSAPGVDWSDVAIVALTALLVGGTAFAAAVGVGYWIRHSDAVGGASGAASAVATRVLRRFRKVRGAADQGRWLCGRCRSWNAPGSRACYRGCGRRETVALLLPDEVARARMATGGPPPPPVARPGDEATATTAGGPGEGPARG
jgi:hypothetical protein